MKQCLVMVLMGCLLAGSAPAQTASELQETARSFMQQGDYSNALLVLNRAAQLEPTNLQVIKDLAFTYYLQKDFPKALSIITPALDREDADDQCYQIAGNCYKQLSQVKDCDRLFRKGIKKFPASGALYNELGELLWAQQDFSAIKQWEKGIEVDPSYSKNYYNACKYYYLSTDKVWSILYGEIFVNMEPLSNRTPEIKTILLESYKKIFTGQDPATGDKNRFSTAFSGLMNRQSTLATTGISTETLIMIRTRFILDWFTEQADKLPFRLFDLHRQLLQDGLFEAYNQWLFGSVQNLAAYQQWISSHAAEYDAFTRFQRGRVYKMPAGQYYRN